MPDAQLPRLRRMTGAPFDEAGDLFVGSVDEGGSLVGRTCMRSVMSVPCMRSISPVSSSSPLSIAMRLSTVAAGRLLWLAGLSRSVESWGVFVSHSLASSDARACRWCICSEYVTRARAASSMLRSSSMLESSAMFRFSSVLRSFSGRNDEHPSPCRPDLSKIILTLSKQSLQKSTVQAEQTTILHPPFDSKGTEHAGHCLHSVAIY